MGGLWILFPLCDPFCLCTTRWESLHQILLGEMRDWTGSGVKGRGSNYDRTPARPGGVNHPALHACTLVIRMNICMMNALIGTIDWISWRLSSASHFILQSLFLLSRAANTSQNLAMCIYCVSVCVCVSETWAHRFGIIQPAPLTPQQIQQMEQRQKQQQQQQRQQQQQQQQLHRNAISSVAGGRASSQSAGPSMPPANVYIYDY